MDSPYSYHDEYWIKQVYNRDRFISFVQGQIIYLRRQYRNEKLQEKVWEFFIMLTSGEVRFASSRIVRAGEPRINNGNTFYQQAIGSDALEKRYLSYEESTEQIKEAITTAIESITKLEGNNKDENEMEILMLFDLKNLAWLDMEMNLN